MAEFSRLYSSLLLLVILAVYMTANKLYHWLVKKSHCPVYSMKTIITVLMNKLKI